MTNFPNGLVADGAMLNPATAYKVEIDASNATPLKVTGGMSATGAVTGASAAITNAMVSGSAAVTGLTNTGTLKVGGGDTINSIVTYTSTNTNVAAVNIVAAYHQEVDATVTGAVNGDNILSIKKTTATASLHVIGGYVSAANTVKILLFGAANSNAHADTFAVTIKR